MWTYNKVLQYPINIKCPNPKLAKNIISQYGGPDGELGASLRYLSQRFAMPDQNAKAILNDVGTEQKARATYEKLIDLSKDDPDVVDVLRFLRQREVVHFQRFGEALRGVQDKLAEKKFYMASCNKQMCNSNDNNT